MQSHDSTPLPRRVKDLTGQRFGRLLVVSFSHIESKSRYAIWNCLCDCGRQHQTATAYLSHGNVRSCGCLGEERRMAAVTKHGFSRHPLYAIYRTMMHRCYNPKAGAYRHYGGRGIAVCQRWRESFLSFVEDMGPKPSPDHSIDRINNDGDYCPENCRWATHEQQFSNRRGSRYLSHNGQTLTMAQWSKILGISSGTIHQRLDSGWTIEQALTTPVETAESDKAKKPKKRR